MLEGGRGAAEIDAEMMVAGYRLGPFALIDPVGADINLAATRSLSAAMGGHPRYHVFAALRDKVGQGDLGRKSGRGFVTPPAVVPTPADAATIRRRVERDAERSRLALVRRRSHAPGDRHRDATRAEFPAWAIRGFGTLRPRRRAGHACRTGRGGPGASERPLPASTRSLTPPPGSRAACPAGASPPRARFLHRCRSAGSAFAWLRPAGRKNPARSTPPGSTAAA